MARMLGDFIIVFFLIFGGVCAGFQLAGRDAEKRLKGELPVDEYWKKRGMK